MHGLIVAQTTSDIQYGLASHVFWFTHNHTHYHAEMSCQNVYNKEGSIPWNHISLENIHYLVIELQNDEYLLHLLLTWMVLIFTRKIWRYSVLLILAHPPLYQNFAILTDALYTRSLLLFDHNYRTVKNVKS